MGSPGKNSGAGASVEMQSLVDSHEQPFVVIDSKYRIVAVNRAYEEAFGVSHRQAVGQACYKISHNSDSPCHLVGQDCPHANLFRNGRQESCLHTHYDMAHRQFQVQVKAYPLRGGSGERFLGEKIERLLGPEDRFADGMRMVGHSPPFLACLKQLNMVAKAQAPVLLQGETGVGKELAAHYIHNNSSRRDKPFLTVDCTVLTESLFEAEVFGHAPGAFTGSVGERMGLFARANGGTLFLDEMGELPLSQQSKLLRVLETGQYRRVGGRTDRRTDVRIICATNRHLWDEVKAGRFREDFYYRVACLTVRLPSLRERLDDIPDLANSLMESIGRSKKQKFRLAPEAIERLKLYEFPGNIRELRNFLFIAAAHIGSGMIDGGVVNEVMAQQLSHRATIESVETPPETEWANDAPGTLNDAEARYIANMLQIYPKNRRKVADLLGVSERTLYRKMRRYHLS